MQPFSHNISNGNFVMENIPILIQIYQLNLFPLIITWSNDEPVYWSMYA